MGLIGDGDSDAVAAQDKDALVRCVRVQGGVDRQIREHPLGIGAKAGRSQYIDRSSARQSSYRFQQ
jgi:argininosuccinate lyase